MKQISQASRKFKQQLRLLEQQFNLMKMQTREPPL